MNKVRNDEKTIEIEVFSATSKGVASVGQTHFSEDNQRPSVILTSNKGSKLLRAMYKLKGRCPIESGSHLFATRELLSGGISSLVCYFPIFSRKAKI